MRLNHVFLRADHASVQLVGEVESDSRTGPFELYFQFPIEYKDFVTVSADPFAAAMLAPAMVAGEALQITPPLSSRLHFQLGRIRDIFQAWYPWLTRSAIDASQGPVDARPVANRAATFFSGGVDSFYTLLKARRQKHLPSPLTHMIFMRGLEKPLDFLRGVEESQQLVEKIAAEVGVRCIVGESNIRTYFDADWLKLYSGSGLAATALSLSGGFSHICIGSSYSYRDPVFLGSTPLVDERYSTDRMQIVHDGADLSRPQKLEQIIKWEKALVLKHLRVCVMNYGGAYNCCRCRKCVRTLLPLRALEILDEATTFPNKSTTHWAEQITTDSVAFVAENVAFLRTHNTDPELTALLERAVLRRRRKETLRTLLEDSPIHGIVPAVQSMRRRLRALRNRRGVT